jgi:hypothetical protein
MGNPRLQALAAGPAASRGPAMGRAISPAGRSVNTGRNNNLFLRKKAAVRFC